MSQISAGRKNKLWIELDGAEEALAFDQEHPEELWCGRREAATIIRRDPQHLSPDAARFATLPPGHPQGYADCFDAFVADFYDAIATRRPVRRPARLRRRPARRTDHRRRARLGRRRVMGRRRPNAHRGGVAR